MEIDLNVWDGFKGYLPESPQWDFHFFPGGIAIWSLRICFKSSNVLKSPIPDWEVVKQIFIDFKVHEVNNCFGRAHKSK